MEVINFDESILRNQSIKRNIIIEVINLILRKDKVLYLEDTSLYEKRLVRQHHQYQAFSLESSIKQQNAYLKLADDLNMPNIKVLKIATDNYEEAYNKLINSIPVLNGIKYTQEVK